MLVATFISSIGQISGATGGRRSREPALPSVGTHVRMRMSFFIAGFDFSYVCFSFCPLLKTQHGLVVVLFGNMTAGFITVLY